MVFATSLLIIALACSAQALSQQPFVATAGPTLFYGSVDGHVLAAGSNASLPGARVWLVNATRGNVAYGPVDADTGGYFYFLDVAPIGPDAYRVKAQARPGTGYSGPFGISGLETRTLDVYVYSRPAAVVMAVPVGYMAANGSDHIPITALVNDSSGHPVAVKCPFTFTIRPDANGQFPGSVGVPGHVRAIHNVSTDSTGHVYTEYGWVKPEYAGKRAVINVYSDDDPGINASMAVDLRGTDTTPPVTTLNASGVSDNVGGFISNVTCTLTAQDNAGGWGVNATYYRLDDGGPVRYGGPFVISREGATTLSYYSIDRAGNAERPKRLTIVIRRSG